MSASNSNAGAAAAPPPLPPPPRQRRAGRAARPEAEAEAAEARGGAAASIAAGTSIGAEAQGAGPQDPPRAPDTSLLPHPYQHVLAYFPRVYALASLFWHRGAPCTFLALAPSLGPLFSFAHLRQMVFLCPSLMQLQPLLQAEEKEDPFAPPPPPLSQLPLPAQYELLSTPLLKRAAASGGNQQHQGARTARDPDRPVRHTGGDRTDLSRPKGPKPTPHSIAEAVLAFKHLVVAHFARPDASMHIPECTLPPHPLPDDPERRQLTVPSYAALDDRATVSVAENTDAATRPRCRESLSEGAEPRGLAALMGVPLPADPAAAPAAPMMDDDEVEIIKRPSSRVRPLVKREHADAAAAAASAGPAAAAAAVDDIAGAAAAAASPAPLKSDPYPHISSPLFHNLLAHLKRQKFYKGQICYVHHIPGRAAITVDIRQKGGGAGGEAASAAAAAAAAAASAEDARAAALLGLAPASPVFLSAPVASALRSLSPPIRSLYVHQSQAINALLEEHVPAVVVSTATSSGKSLCYTLPILESLQADPESRALCLFPTKALAQDQLRSLRQFLQRVGGAAVGVDTYDGDTPSAARPAVRDRARVLLSNPDMLHVSMLPLHGDFAPFLRKLKFVVLDEAHVYRGLFGAHVCLILRRLRRLCRFYGSSPQFILCSATIANPLELAGKLLGFAPGEEVRLVDEDGAAHGEKQFLLYNPPLLAPTDPAAAAEKSLQGAFNSRAFEYAPFLSLSAQVVRRSSHMESSLLLANLVQLNYKSIAFCNSRKVAELVAGWTREILAMSGPRCRELIPLVASYRGGYRPEDRRRIEADLFAGKLRGVVSTNALELGIDIGSLDATVHIGLPPTMANLLQQSGRSGRGTRPSLSILVAYDSPLDQFYMRSPAALFERRAEKAVVDFESPELIQMHAMCAAAELPLCPATDRPLFGPRFDEVFLHLRDDLFWIARRPRDPLIRSPFDGAECYDLVNGVWEREFLAKYAPSAASSAGRCVNTEAGPASCFSIRATSSRTFQIVDESNGGSVIDETEHRRAMFDLHEGALYANQGAEYIVRHVDHAMGHIKVRRVPGGGAKYYTKCVDRKWTTCMSRALAFTKEETGEDGGGSGKEAEEEEQKEEVIPPSLSATLAAMHASLSNRAAGRPSASSDADNDPSWSLLPYPSPAQWYIKAEVPLLWRHFCSFGHVKVSTSVFAYRKISKVTLKVLERQELHMPLHEFDTHAAWLDVPVSIQEAFGRHVQSREGVEQQEEAEEHKGEQLKEEAEQEHGARRRRGNKRMKLEGASAAAAFPPAASSATVASSPHLLSASARNALQSPSIHAGLHGLTHCLIALLPMYLLCDGPADMRCDCPSVYERSYEERRARPCRVLLYENQPSAGMAFVRATARVLHLLVSHARQVIESCPCTGVQGCPSCVQSSRCTELNEVTSKEDALWLATALEQWARETPLPG